MLACQITLIKGGNINGCERNLIYDRVSFSFLSFLFSPDIKVRYDKIYPTQVQAKEREVQHFNNFSTFIVRDIYLHFTRVLSTFGRFLKKRIGGKIKKQKKN